MNGDPANPKDRTPAQESQGDPEQPERRTPVVGNASGRVKFDERGNAVWEWAVGTGSFGAETSSKRIQKLVNPLSIAEDPKPAAAPPQHEFVAPERPRTAAADRPTAAGPVTANRKGMAHGYSPYDSGVLVKPAAQRPKKKDLRRLGEWLKLRDQANRNKKDD